MQWIPFTANTIPERDGQGSVATLRPLGSPGMSSSPPAACADTPNSRQLITRSHQYGTPCWGSGCSGGFWRRRGRGVDARGDYPKGKRDSYPTDGCWVDKAHRTQNQKNIVLGRYAHLCMQDDIDQSPQITFRSPHEIRTITNSPEGRGRLDFERALKPSVKA